MPGKIDLIGMDLRHHGLTPSVAGVFHEAASVTLNRYHSPPTEVTIVDNGMSGPAEIHWQLPDQRVLDAHNNEIDATEQGAYGCAIGAIEVSRGLFAIRRAETLTGSDYYIGPKGAGDDLEDCVRLEVSGTSKGTSKEVNARLTIKINQARAGNSNLPAVAAVVGFAVKLIMLQDV
jgi:hypothetical protein